MLSESKILARLMIQRFGNEAEKWFSKSVLLLAAELKFDENTKKLIDKSTCKYAPLTNMQLSDITDDQLLALFGNENTSGNDQMQIDSDNSSEDSNCDMEDSKDEEDEGMFTFQQQYEFTNLEKMFPDTPAINIGPQKDGSTIASQNSGFSKAWQILNQEETERQTGENQDG